VIKKKTTHGGCEVVSASGRDLSLRLNSLLKVNPSPGNKVIGNHVVIVLIEMFGTRQPMVLQELQVFLSRWILDNNNILVVISFGC